MDNANNMSVLGLWDPLLSLLNSPHQPIVSHSCWVIGTAVQNNLKAQAGVRLTRLMKSNSSSCMFIALSPPFCLLSILPRPSLTAPAIPARERPTPFPRH